MLEVVVPKLGEEHVCLITKPQQHLQKRLNICQMDVPEFDLITTLKLYIYLFRSYSFLLVEYGHLLKNKQREHCLCMPVSEPEEKS